MTKRHRRCGPARRCGHSLGGRLLAELAAAEPQRAMALLLVDAAVGEAWDDLASFACWNPALLGVVGATLAADTLQTMFLTGDQGAKLQGLAVPQAMANAFAPWKLVAPALSVLLSARSGISFYWFGRHRDLLFFPPRRPPHSSS